MACVTPLPLCDFYVPFSICPVPAKTQRTAFSIYVCTLSTCDSLLHLLSYLSCVNVNFKQKCCLAVIYFICLSLFLTSRLLFISTVCPGLYSTLSPFCLRCVCLSLTVFLLAAPSVATNYLAPIHNTSPVMRILLSVSLSVQ